MVVPVLADVVRSADSRSAFEQSLAIAEFATTPVPTGGAGTTVWSTTESAIIVWNGTSWRLVHPRRVLKLSANVVNNNAIANTLQDVTGLQFPVVSGGVYFFRFNIGYTAQAATTGCRWSINGPAITTLMYKSQYTLAATTNTLNSGLSAYNLPAASSTGSVAAVNRAYIDGTIQPSASGNVIARFASEVASSAITALANASFVEYERIG